MGEKVPGWLERLLLPKLSSLEGELKAFRGEGQGEFKSIHSEIRRLDTRIDALEKRLDLTERVTSLEARVEALQAGKA
ncbi:MAG: hypothetical protein HYU03_07415 [Thaumarchaeota archaeon]|nr:hypothetical protein [Nitrososphaerota archaeon]MBI3115870.1 hypothetical protein [Nitrososphaerota archaeon]MCS4540500.1 hypothetical protein [Nitrososphaerota archaeon]